TLGLALLLMCLAQLSKIVCYNPKAPYLIIFPTILLSAGMLFFFTLGSSMVGDICDEDELNTGYRAEGSYYSIFWWLIKMGTALASFVAGALIVLTAFDEIQVTKVDSIQGAIRGIRNEIQSWQEAQAPSPTPAALLNKIKTHVGQSLDEAKNYASYLETESAKHSSKSGPSIPEVQKRKTDQLRDALTTIKS